MMHWLAMRRIDPDAPVFVGPMVVPVYNYSAQVSRWWLGSLLHCHDLRQLPVAPSVSCPCVDTRLTRRSKLPSSPAASRRLPMSTTRLSYTSFCSQPPPSPGRLHSKRDRRHAPLPACACGRHTLGRVPGHPQPLRPRPRRADHDWLSAVPVRGHGFGDRLHTRASDEERCQVSWAPSIKIMIS